MSMKRIKQIYAETFRAIDELRAGKITPKEANKRAKQTKAKLKKIKASLPRKRK